MIVSVRLSKLEVILVVCSLEVCLIEFLLLDIIFITIGIIPKIKHILNKA